MTVDAARQRLEAILPESCSRSERFRRVPNPKVGWKAVIVAPSGHRCRRAEVRGFDLPRLKPLVHCRRVASSTSREIEILRLLARGLSNKQIASRLTISAKTAGSYVEHIFAKIGVGNRAMASLYAAKHGLITVGAEDPSTTE